MTDKLSDQQRLAIAALLGGKGRVEAAEAAGVDRTTLWRWLQNDAAFLAHLNEAREDIHAANVEKLRGLASEAVDVLGNLLKSSDEKIRLDAAVMIEELFLFGRPVSRSLAIHNHSKVYLMQKSNGECKIGISKDPEKRRKQFIIVDPSVKILHIFEADDAAKSEKDLHHIFREKNVGGEWFRLSQDDIAEIQLVIEYKDGKFIR